MIYALIIVTFRSLIARPELIQAISADSLFVFAPENTGLVAVERQRFSMMLKLPAGGHHVIKDGCSLTKSEMKNAAGSH